MRKTLANPPPGTPAITLYRYDPYGKISEEIAGSSANAGQTLVTYIWKDDIPSAVIYAPGTPSNTGTIERIVYLHADHLNTPRKTSDSQGRIVWSWESDAFGSTAPNEDVDGDGQKTVINLRLPGQYFDAESGLHYNWHRYFDPQAGRYTQPDPIGLAGGINPFSYAENQPTSLTDPLGLTTYMCTQPLHALGDKWGPRLYPESRFNPSPFFHQYVCVPDGKGGVSCGGQDRADGPFGPGKPSSDTYRSENCKPVDERQCVEQCLLTKVNDPNRPAYALFGGGGRNAGAQNCQQWADQKLQECQQQCKAK